MRLSLSSTFSFFVFLFAVLLSPRLHAQGTPPYGCGDTLAASAIIQQFPYFQNFERGKGGWYHGRLSSILVPVTPPQQPLPASSWQFGSPAKPNFTGCASGDSCWVTGLTANYRVREESYVVSPAFNFSNLVDPLFAASIRFDLESPFDGVTLQSSVDSGRTWQAVGILNGGINWFNNANINSTPGSLVRCTPQNFLGWTGISTTSGTTSRWIRAQISVQHLTGLPHVMFRFALAADQFVTDDGFAFDDVAIAERPVIDLGPNRTLCFGQSFTLDAGCQPKAKYLWSTSLLDTLCTIFVITNGRYWVRRTDSLGMVASDTITINRSPTGPPNPPLVDQILCPGDTALLDARNPSANHAWYEYDSTLQQFVLISNAQRISVARNGAFRLLISDNVGCRIEDTIRVSIDEVPVINLGPDVSICVGEAVVVAAPPGPIGTLYDWTRNSQSFAQTRTVFPSAPGKYKVILTTPAGCKATDSMNLFVVLSPVINLGKDRIECDSILLDAGTPGATYLWSDNFTGRTRRVFPPFTAWVKVTNQFGCFAYDTISLSYSPPPVLNLGGDRVVCGTNTVLLDAGNNGTGLTYLWSTSWQGQQLTVTQPGLYIVTITDAFGCKRVDSANITLSNLRVNLGPDTVLCAGNSLLLNAAQPNSNYAWNTGASNSSIIVNTGGVYGVIVQDIFGCIASDSVNITLRPPYIGNFEADSSYIRFRNTHTFRAINNPSGTNSWIWRFGDGRTGTGQVVTHRYNALDTFTVCLTISDGQCRDTVCKQVGNFLVYVGLDELPGVSMEIYPNPTQNRFTVNLQMLENSRARLDLLDTRGRLIEHRNIRTSQQHAETFDLSGRAAGVYMVRITTPKGSATRKLVLL